MAGNRRSHMKKANIALLIIAVAAAVVAVALALTGAFRKSNEDFDFGVSDSGRNETVQEDTGSDSGSGSGNTGSGGGSSSSGNTGSSGGSSSSNTGSGSGNTGSTGSESSDAGTSDGVENGPVYSLKDGTYEFSWSDTCTETSIDIPSSYDGVAVTSIADSAFYGCDTVVSVSIPNSVTSIGVKAFYGCTSLSSVTIPSSVTSIGSSAFSGCSSLECITIPSDMITIGTYAFYNCTAVTEIYFDAVAMNNLSSNNYVFYNAGKNANGITVTIGAEVTKIPAYIFYPYSSSTSPKITTVIFEDGSQCESIGTYAFANCINLLSFTVPKNCTSIGSNAFYNCYKLVQVNNLSTLNLTLGLDNYGYVACYAICVSSDGSDVGTFYTIDDVFVFYEYDGTCNFITYLGTETDITLPDTVEGKSYGIYDYSFSNFTDIESVKLGSGTTSIGSYAFYSCTALKSITMNESVTSIGAYAFDGCSSLESVVIPESVTSIGGSAFYECTALEEIYFDAVAMNNLSSNNYVFYNAGKNANGITVTIGAGVTKIPAYLFCPYFTSSYGPKITTVIFEDGSQCTSIGSYAFQYCTSLTEVIFKDGSQCTSIGSYAFSDCTSLTSIVIPGTVTSVGNYAFDSCKNLSAVYYHGTAEGWNQISISSTYNTYFTSCTIYYYSETQPSVNGNYWYYDDDGFPVIWKKL